MEHRIRKIVTLFFLSLFFALGFGFAQDEPSDLLDFWVGTWEVSWDEPEGKKGRGVNRIEKTMDDSVIQEHFEVHEGRAKGFKGTSISVYQPRTGKWRQSWADSQGGFFCFIGDLHGDRKIFQTAIRETEDGKRNTQRMVFHHIESDAMIWDWESSSDGGETWTLNWQINYKRKKP